MKKILVIYNNELATGVFKDQYESYVQSFLKIGVGARAVSSSEILSTVYDDGEKIDADGAVFLDKDIYLAMLLELKGLKLFNPAECIRVCDDKALTYITLYKNGIPIPKTIVAPKIYGETSFDWCEKAVRQIGYPLVIKECFGSLGMQVYLAENKKEMMKVVKDIGEKPFVIQEFLKEGSGWDIRVIVADGEVIGVVKRSSEKDFRANAARGGKLEPFDLSEEDKKLAISAVKAVGGFFAGVDLIRKKDGFVVCEVNSNMLFAGAQSALGISISDIIAEKIKRVV